MAQYPNDQSNALGAIPVWIAPAPLAAGGFLDYQQIDLSDNAVHTLPVVAGATYVLASVEGGNARYLIGEDPTAGSGMPLWGTATATFRIADVRFIQMTGSTTAKLNLMYFGVAP